jgi:NitT/TauT family transport system permease protein
MSFLVERTGPRIVWRAREDTEGRGRFMTMRRREILVSIFSPVVILIAWELLVRATLLDARFFPAPSSIVGTFWAVIRSGELANAVMVSLTRIFAGFLMGAIPALFLGLVLGLSRMVRAFANPIVYALYPVPKVAILPLVMLIFGLGEMSKYVIIAIAVFFLVLVNTTAGVVMIDRIHFDVARNFNASRRDFYLHVVLRGALPSIFTGLKLALGVALIVLVTAEFVAARSGIGVLIYESWQVFAIERLFVGLVVVSFLGYVLSLLLDELERLVIPWQRDRR